MLARDPREKPAEAFRRLFEIAVDDEFHSPLGPQPDFVSALRRKLPPQRFLVVLEVDGVGRDIQQSLIVARKAEGTSRHHGRVTEHVVEVMDGDVVGPPKRIAARGDGPGEARFSLPAEQDKASREDAARLAQQAQPGLVLHDRPPVIFLERPTIFKENAAIRALRRRP